MPRPLRYQSAPWSTHHVVSRCLQGFAFLKPTPAVVETCAGLLAYSLDQHQEVIKLHHYAFLSNHFHLILSARTRGDLSSFMRLFKSKLTRELNRIHDWGGTIWSGRYASEELLDEGSVLKLLAYVTQNSVKEGLVDHPKQWSGLHGYHLLVEKKTPRGAYLDRTRLQREPELTAQEATTYYDVQLSPPPLWEDEGMEAYQARCATLFEEAIAEAQQARDGRSSLGMAQVISQPLLKEREAPKGGRPLCRAQCRELLKAFKERYRIFKRQFQEVSREVRRSITLGLPLPPLCFPEGGVPLFGACEEPS